MLESVLTVLAGLLGGVAVGLQSPLSGYMGKRVGGLGSSFLIHLSGALLSGLLLLLRGGENIVNWRSLPWYVILASGGFGVILYLTLTATLPRLGAAAAITLIVVGQLTLGLLIDHYGWFDMTIRPIDLTRVVGTGLLLAGAYLMVR
jgi:transporter family-2 protein